MDKGKGACCEMLTDSSSQICPAFTKRLSNASCSISSPKCTVATCHEVTTANLLESTSAFGIASPTPSNHIQKPCATITDICQHRSTKLQFPFIALCQQQKTFPAIRYRHLMEQSLKCEFQTQPRGGSTFQSTARRQHFPQQSDLGCFPESACTTPLKALKNFARAHV